MPPRSQPRAMTFTGYVDVLTLRLRVLIVSLAAAGHAREEKSDVIFDQQRAKTAKKEG